LVSAFKGKKSEVAEQKNKLRTKQGVKGTTPDARGDELSHPGGGKREETTTTGEKKNFRNDTRGLPGGRSERGAHGKKKKSRLRDKSWPPPDRSNTAGPKVSLLKKKSNRKKKKSKK